MLIPVRVCYPEVWNKGKFKWKKKELNRLFPFIVWEKGTIYKSDILN